MYVVIQWKVHAKYKGRGIFAISCTIGNVGIKNATCDLAISINIMLLSIYTSLDAGRLKKKSVVIQLADKSIIYPEGLLEVS